VRTPRILRRRKPPLTLAEQVKAAHLADIARAMPAHEGGLNEFCTIEREDNPE
jgi:hypothetical protein